MKRGVGSKTRKVGCYALIVGSKTNEADCVARIVGSNALASDCGFAQVHDLAVVRSPGPQIN